MILGMTPRATAAAALRASREWGARVAADVFSHHRRRFMQVNITFRHLDSTEALKSHARGKVEHIQRYIDRPSEAHVVLYVENLEHKEDLNLKPRPFPPRGRALTRESCDPREAASEKGAGTPNEIR